MSEFPRAPSAGNVVASTSEQGRGGEVVSEPVPGVPARHGPANLTRALSVITAALGDAGGLAGPASRLTTGATARQDSSAGMAGACPPASYPPIGDYAPLSDGHSAALVCPGTGRSTGAASTASTPARCSPASSTGTATATSAWHRSAPTPWPGATGPARMCSRPASARGGRGRGGRLHGDPPRRIRRRRHQLPPPAAPPRARRGRLCEDAVGFAPRSTTDSPSRASRCGGTTSVSSTAAPTPSCSSPSCPLPRSRYAAAAGSGAGRRREVFLALTYSLPHRLEAHRTGRDGMRERIEATCRFWMDWSSACTYEGPYRDEGAAQHPRPQGPHQHSTGAIFAAPTMSLPEELGWRAQLGLPLLVAARRRPQPLYTVQPGLHRGGPRLHGLGRANHGGAG